MISETAHPRESEADRKGRATHVRSTVFILTILLLSFLPAHASAQEISADGRSIVGRTTLLDKLVQVLDPDKLLIGLDSGELLRYGEAVYPEEGHEFNRAGHRLGARILTRRYGVVVATALGVLNEVFEAYNLRELDMPYFSEPRFDFGDIGANLRGTFDAYAEDLNTPWGLWRMVRRLSSSPVPRKTSQSLSPLTTFAAPATPIRTFGGP